VHLEEGVEEEEVVHLVHVVSQELMVRLERQDHKDCRDALVLLDQWVTKDQLVNQAMMELQALQGSWDHEVIQERMELSVKEVPLVQ